MINKLVSSKHQPSEAEASLTHRFRVKGKSLLAHLVCTAVTIGISANSSMAATLISDDFNRPNGVVGNGWSTWGNSADLLSGQLETFGQTSVAGGIDQSLAVSFPLSFAFDFRTTAPTDGGWQIGFNSSAASDQAHAQVGFIQVCCGSIDVDEFYMTSGGQQVVPGSVTGTLENFSVASFGHIAGSVNADLSAMITITYADGSQVSIDFGAPVGALGPQGSLLFLGNSNATFGPHYIDNLVVTSGVPEPGTFLFCGAAMSVLAIRLLKFRKSSQPIMTVRGVA